MAGIITSPAAFMTALLALLDGLQNSMPAGLTQLAAGGKVTLLTDLQDEVKGYLASYQLVEKLSIDHANAVIERDKIAPDAIARYEEIRASVKAALGKKSPNLPKLGIAADKTPAPLTSEQKVERAEKAKATRAARHTMGPKQKKAIHGQLPAPTPAPAPPLAPPPGTKPGGP